MAAKRNERRKMSVPDKLAVKWNVKVLDEGFIPFPKRLLRSMSAVFVGKTRMSKLRVVLAIVDFRRSDFPEHPTVELLAYTAGMQRKKVEETLTELAQERLLDIDVLEDGKLSISINGVLKRIVEETDDG